MERAGQEGQLSGGGLAERAKLAAIVAQRYASKGVRAATAPWLPIISGWMLHCMKAFTQSAENAADPGHGVRRAHRLPQPLREDRAKAELIERLLEKCVMRKMAYQMKMDTQVEPFLGKRHIHALIERSSLRHNRAMTVLEDDRRLLSFPVKAITGQHIGQYPILLNHDHAGIAELRLKRTTNPCWLINRTGGQKRAVRLLAFVRVDEEGNAASR